MTAFKKDSDELDKTFYDCLTFTTDKLSNEEKSEEIFSEKINKDQFNYLTAP